MTARARRAMPSHSFHHDAAGQPLPAASVSSIALHMRMIRRRAGGQADSGWISPQAADRAGRQWAGDRRIGIVRRRGGVVASGGIDCTVRRCEQQGSPAGARRPRAFTCSVRASAYACTRQPRPDGGRSRPLFPRWAPQGQVVVDWWCTLAAGRGRPLLRLVALRLGPVAPALMLRASMRRTSERDRKRRACVASS